MKQSNPRKHRLATFEALESRLLMDAASMQALFQEQYYLNHNPDVAAAVAAHTYSSGWEHFLGSGQFEGRKPNPYFEETYYRQANSDVNAVVGTVFQSGFDHFATYGAKEGRNPDPFFSAKFYLDQNPTVAAAVTAGTYSSAFAQFLAAGAAQQLSPSPLFNEGLYLTAYGDVRSAVQAGSYQSGLQHFLENGAREGRYSTFGESTYLTMYSDVASAVNSGTFTSGYQHYTLYGANEGRALTPLYNETYYLAANPDVASAVSSGTFRSGLDHFARYGQFEGRYAAFDEAKYRAKYSDVASAITSHVFTSGLQHYLLFGKNEGRTSGPLVNASTYAPAATDAGKDITAGVYRSAFEQFSAEGQFVSGARGRPSKIYTLKATQTGQDGLQVIVNEQGFVTTAAGLSAKYKVVLHALSSNDIIAAADVKFTGNLYQIARSYDPDVIPTPTLTQATSLLSLTNSDTHFMFTDSQIGSQTAPTEDNDVRYGISGNTISGMGTDMHLISAFDATYRAISETFAWLVVPDGGTAYLSNYMSGFGSETGGVFSIVTPILMTS